MYSPVIIEKNLDRFAASEGWRPVRHSYEQVQEFAERLKKIVSIESNSKSQWPILKRGLTGGEQKQIRQWVENEQAMCTLDCGYWETRYAYVCDEKAEIYKFQPRLSQQIYNSVVADFDERQVSIELLILKGRQLGITTQTALKFLHRMLFMPHTQAIMASVKAESSQLISRIIDTAYDRLPFWLPPARLPKRAYDNGSILSVQSGMQATGLAQGWTPSCVHLSELADIPDPKKTIEEGLFRAAHSSKNLFMVLEGTGGGSTGWLADTWRASKEDFPKGRARLCPIFIPWPMCPEIYPQEDWIRKFPVENSWRPNEITRKHVARAESYIRNTPYLARVAGANYRMPIEQQWFWQFNYESACKNHTQKTWAAQMPCDDYEALTGVHDPIFDPEVISEIEDRIYEIIGTSSADEKKVRRIPLQAYSIVGHSIDETFDPEDDMIDDSKPPIEVIWKSNRGERYDWTLVPLRFSDEGKETDTFDKLLVYEPPQRGAEYSCGVDSADGLDKEDEERACASMTRNQHGNECDVQVAEITSRRMNPAQLVPFVACMAAWYGERSKDSRGVKFAIEQIRGPGDTCQNQLKIMGFNYHHRPRRYDSKKIKDSSHSKEGWYSNAWSVPIMMTHFVEAVNSGRYQPMSKWLIEEIKTLERHITSGKSKMEHRAGHFDDRVRAAAMSFFTVHDLDDLADRAQRRYAVPSRRKADPNEGYCMANSISVGFDDE